MKHLLIAALFVFGAAATFAQNNDSNPVDGPVMTFESLDVDYGEIEQGSDPLRIVEFTNTGTAPLIISNARGSCGCTVPTWPKEPIMPGETSEIEIRYDTKRVGPISKTVTISTNEAEGKHILRVKGQINKVDQEESLPKKESILNETDGE